MARFSQPATVAAVAMLAVVGLRLQMLDSCLQGRNEFVNGAGISAWSPVLIEPLAGVAEVTTCAFSNAVVVVPAVVAMREIDVSFDHPTWVLEQRR